jgi:hypothetical protein
MSFGHFIDSANRYLSFEAALVIEPIAALFVLNVNATGCA